jgi:HEPN domain-containing protein
MKEETKKWLIKAINDYKTAKRLLKPPEDEIITDTLCFHCQQTVEKFLKAFLVENNIDFEKIHTLEYLIKLCSTVDSNFENLYEVAEKLASYAISIRYPDEFYIPSVKEAEEAFRLATSAKVFILKKLKIGEDDLK